MKVPVCEVCLKECEVVEVEVDNSFYYEYGDEARTHIDISIEETSECCEGLVIQIEESNLYAHHNKKETTDDNARRT